MTNKIQSIKRDGHIIVGNATIFTHAPDTLSYCYAPQFDAVKQYRLASKQGLIIGLALREQGASIDAIYAVGGVSIASAYSYLSRDFAGKKGYGVYLRYMSRRAYLAQFDSDTVRAIEARHFSAACALGDTGELDAGVVVIHAWHDVTKAGRAPCASDFDAGSIAAHRVLGTLPTVLNDNATDAQHEALQSLLTPAPVVKATKSASKKARRAELKAARASVKVVTE